MLIKCFYLCVNVELVWWSVFRLLELSLYELEKLYKLVSCGVFKVYNFYGKIFNRKVI